MKHLTQKPKIKKKRKKKDMYSGEFDGAAAAFCGGFMPSQATAVPDHSSLSKVTIFLSSLFFFKLDFRML